ncbi:MAG TPA: hypothetical protein VGE24_15070 [Emticicia sp.]
MKKVVVLLLFVFVGFALNAQMLVRVSISRPDLVGYGATMYYVLNDSVCEKVSQMETLTERSILELWGLPLMDNKLVMGECRAVDSISLELENLFFNPYSYKIDRKVGEYDFLLTFIQIANLEYCVSKLTGRYWASYAGRFEKGGLLTLVPEIVEIESTNKVYIDKINCSLSKRWP